MSFKYAALVFVFGELVALVLFGVLRERLGSEPTRRAKAWSATKGVLERLTLFVGLLTGFPQVLIVFGALKIGTRLTEDKGSVISNDYFLVGNLISLLLAISYTAIATAIW